MKLVVFIFLLTFIQGIKSNKEDDVDLQFKRLEEHIMELSLQLQDQALLTKEQGKQIKDQAVQLQKQDQILKDQSMQLREQARHIHMQDQEMDIMKTTIASQAEETILIKLQLADVWERNRIQDYGLSKLKDMLRTESNSEIKSHDKPNSRMHRPQKNKSEEIESPVIQTMVEEYDEPLDRSDRLLTPSATSPPSSSVKTAFYAHLSKQEHAPVQHHALVFDVVTTNVNGGYSKYTGVFIVPVDGIYVFTFTIRMGCRALGAFEIVKNAEVVGVFYSQQNDDCENDLATGIVVISTKQGDMVHLRTHSTLSFSGDIESNVNGWSTFSGWSI